MSVARRRIIPQALFLEGEAGTYSDIETYATNYFSDAGTTPAVLEDPIYQINDQSGNGVNWTQATATARPILQSDSSGEYLRFDLGDDVLNCTLAAGTYTVALPTREGIWIDEVAHAGGTFSIGPTSYTGGPTGILTALATGGECRMIGPPMAVNRSLTAAEQAALVQWFQNRGAGPELELGPELLVNGGFDSDLSGWGRVSGPVPYWDAGKFFFVCSSAGFPGVHATSQIDSGSTYMLSADKANDTSGILDRVQVRAQNGSDLSTVNLAIALVAQGVGGRAAGKISSTSSRVAVYSGTSSGDTVWADNISLRKLQPKGA